jgi:hypothetical protein
MDARRALDSMAARFQNALAEAIGNTEHMDTEKDAAA